MVLSDDILVYSKVQEKHAMHLRIVLQILRNHQLVAKRPKCGFWMATIEFLECKILHKGILVNLIRQI